MTIETLEKEKVTTNDEIVNEINNIIDVVLKTTASRTTFSSGEVSDVLLDIRQAFSKMN